MKNNYLKALFVVFVCFAATGFSQNFIDKYLSDPLTYTIIGNSSNSINQPRDLDFKTNSNELWIVNYGTTQGGSTVIFYNAGQNNQTSQYRKDSHTSHFMMYPSALAFSDIGEWASTGEIKNTANASSTFMGPTLWSGDTNITAKVCQNNWVNGYPLGSHLDMLHQSPFAMGIAHDTAKTYWVYDGYNSDICKYNFNMDHSPGYDNHSAGEIWRYSDVNVLRSPGIPSHMILDKSSKWLYIVDAGNKRLMRINTLTGNIVGNLTAPNEVLTLYKNVTGCVQQVIDTYTSQPSGIDYNNNRLIVSDYQTGDIRVYNTSTPTLTLMGIIPTGQPGIMGVKIGYDGKIWFVNNMQNTVVRIDPLPTTIDASIYEINSPSVENSESKFYSPAFNICNGSITPQVTLKNSGSTALTSAVISYKIDAGSVVSFTWTGNLSSGTTASVMLPSSTVLGGAHKIKVYCSNPNNNTDLNTLNDVKEGSFRSQNPVMNLPFMEDFTNATFPPQGWSYIGYNKFCNMTRNATVGAYGNGLGALKMDNFSGSMNITGQNDYFLSPRIDFSSASEITYLTFDLAYAQRNTSSTDQLDVSISTDCGASWTSLYTKAGIVLSTTTNVSYAYSPAPEEWRTDSIDLATYKGLPEVMLMFTTNSNWGNNLYIDNINISSVSTVSIKKNSIANYVKVYPNPSTGKVMIEALNSKNAIEFIHVNNAIGQEIINLGNQTDKVFSLDLSSFPEGAYFVSIKTDSQLIVKKIILTRN